jgi:hypothetical protein
MSQISASSTLKVEATCSFETWIYIQRIARHYIPQLNTHPSYSSENLKIVYFPIHKTRPLDNILYRCKSVRTLILYSYQIHFNVIVPPTVVSPKISLHVFLQNFCMDFSSSRACYISLPYHLRLSLFNNHILCRVLS